MLYVTVRVLYVKVECQHFQDAGKNVVWLLVSYDLFTFQNGLEEQKLSLKQNSYFPATPIPQCAILTHREMVTYQISAMSAILEARLGENFIGPKNHEQVYLELVFLSRRRARV